MASPPTQRMRRTFYLLSLAAALGCAAATAGGRSTKNAAGPVFISEEQIRESGATTAWDAIRRTAPHFHLGEKASGQPTQMKRRGRSSLYLDDTPEVFLDGVRVSDFRSLALIPANTIFSITILSGIDATTYYGTNAGNGVILIRTKTN